jgi:uncharacterized repeat protein (TIGR04138 family)
MPTLEPSHPLAKLLKRDKRYKFDAYLFVFESLEFAEKTVGLGEEKPTEEEEPAPSTKRLGKGRGQRHLTGQQLCDAVRRYAIEQFGLMAKAVLNSWGVRSTGDVGNIVFNLIEIEQMKKTKHDKREDFDNVFDFETVFVRDFKIQPPQLHTK